jgi:nucleoside-diphosphate-sugar epimerase
MKKVLVTGATGFIGRHTLLRLEQRGFEVYALTSKQPPPSSSIRWIQADLLHERSFEWLARLSPTHLLHLAWNAVPGTFWTTRENVAWLSASLALFEAFAASGGTRAVCAGSCAEYDWKEPVFAEYQTPCLPHTLYGSCKLALQGALALLAKQFRVSHAWGRLFYLYGPHEYKERFVPTLINGLLHRRQVPCSQGTQVRDFLHVEDVADAFVSLLDSDVEGVVNIGSGEGISLKQITEIIAENLRAPGLIQFGALPAPAGDPPRLVPCVQRLKEELKWAPRHTLHSGLASTIDWWKGELA